jgi:hypothetical protein
MFNVTLVGPYNNSTTVVNLSVIMALFVQMDLVSYCKQPLKQCNVRIRTYNCGGPVSSLGQFM